MLRIGFFSLLCLVGCDLSNNSVVEQTVQIHKCAEYKPPSSFEFYIWDVIGPRDPCYVGEVDALKAFLAQNPSPEDQLDISGNIGILYAEMGQDLIAQSWLAYETDTIKSGNLIDDSKVFPDGRFALAQGFLQNHFSKHQLIILNEDHSKPQHRDFAQKLLPDLWKAGFRYIAVEAFNPDPTKFERTIINGAPTFDTGYYLRDPAFSRFIREAKSLGFNLIPYEVYAPINGSEKEYGDNYHSYRETSQAVNIYNRTFKKDPNARVFVYAGFSHLLEGKKHDLKQDKKPKWMAEYLSELSGLNPLTIDQTSSPIDTLNLQSKKVEGITNNTEPLILLDDNDEANSDIGPYAGNVDVVVVHQKSSYINGRPNWIKSNNTQSEIHVKPPQSGLLQIIIKGDTPNAVPFDQVLVKQGSKTRMLTPKGKSFQVRLIPWDYAE